MVEQADRDIPEGGHDLGAVPGIFGIGVFGPGGVAQPVDGLNAPLAAGDRGEVRGSCAFCVQTGDGMHDLLGDEGAVKVVAVAADPDGLGGVGRKPSRCWRTRPQTGRATSHTGPG